MQGDWGDDAYRQLWVRDTLKSLKNKKYGQEFLAGQRKSNASQLFRIELNLLHFIK